MRLNLGTTKRMLAAALTHAYQRGAQVVGAYPVLEDSLSYRFIGFVPMFEKAGFLETGREGSAQRVSIIAVFMAARWVRLSGLRPDR
jgi:hypothetical protein